MLTSTLALSAAALSATHEAVEPVPFPNAAGGVSALHLPRAMAHELGHCLEPGHTGPVAYPSSIMSVPDTFKSLPSTLSPSDEPALAWVDGSE